MSVPQRKLPSDRTIAFAAAIVSSKPSDLTVREYITLLLRHVAKGRRENALSVAYRHLDCSAYWRAECERAKEDCRSAEQARVDALREVDSLKAKLEFAKAAAAGSGGVKRKRGGEDVVPYSREIKKGCNDADERREVFLGGIVIEEIGGGEGNVGCDALMRSLYQIGLCFKPGVHVESATLAYHLVSATEEVFGVVLEALGQHNYASHSCSDELSVAMTAAGRVFAGVMTGVQKLHRMKEANLVAGKVTYAIVRMYERLAGGLDTISENEAKLEQKADPINDPKNMSARQKTKSKGPPRVNIKDVPVLNALTAFLSGVIKQLDVKEASHREIFEGFLFCALSKVGKNIYTIVFSQPRGLSISEEIHSGTLPDDSNQTEFALPLRQAQLEAPYLIHLLKQVLALAPTFISPSTAPLSRPAKLKTSAKPGSVTKASLTLATKERLQATLINAIFGTEGLDEESDLMLNCLQAPAAVGHQLPVPRVKEAEIGEWFQGEVWRLLGWEALGRELGDHGRRWL